MFLVRRGVIVMYERSIVSYVIKHYPTNSTALIAEELNLSSNQVRTIAKHNNVVKCKEYKKQLQKDLVRHRRKWYEENIPDFSPTYSQKQIILGSLLGDGYISKGAQRSINYYYQEHFGENQREYRQWKLSKLKDLNFNISGNFLHSRSHPFFTTMHQLLYPDGIKRLTKSYLSKCNHPIFLSTLYLDDGSLTISYHYNENKNIVYCHPSITLYTLNFTKTENQRLATHLNKTFNTNFVITRHPDGHNNLLKINKEFEVRHFLKIIKPWVKDIPSMRYKTCLEKNIKLKKPNIKERFGKDVQIKISSSNRRKLYSTEEIENIIKLKTLGCTDNDIASFIDRSYWSVVYKIQELRKGGLL